MTTKQSRIAKWEKIREKGKNQFIIKFGVIGWGIPTAILWGITMFFVTSGPKTFLKFVIWVGVALIVFPIGGYFWGLWMWWWSERWYKKLSKNQKQIKTYNHVIHRTNPALRAVLAGDVSVISPLPS